ncbi:MAG: Hpt domain-containing protein [Pseudomonadota bacterium]
MQPNAQNSSAADLDLAVNDLGPLAWVLEELRKSLDGSAKALKRFVRDAEAARGSDLATIDASQLRIARQQLHQAVGALEMVGLAAPALVLRAMEAAVQKFVQQPEHCTQDAAAKIERASFALTEYLEGVLADKPISSVSLFPQYREVQELIKADRIHPADLWTFEWRWLEPDTGVAPAPQTYGAAPRSVLDQSVLQIMKGNAPQAARTMGDLSLAFAAAQTDRQPRIFWKIAAAYFEALVHNLLPSDIYVRRAASRILLQYASLAKGDPSISERLAQDLLFYCAQAVAARASDAPVLSAVRAAYGLARFKPVDYDAVQFGRFDPALLAQARKRIISAKETWSSLSAGDAGKFKVVVDQFSLVTDSLIKLHPASEPLAQALSRAVDVTARSGQTPPIGLAMEVATSVLYLEAAFDDLDPNDPQLAVRTKHLAGRLEGVRGGGEPQPLEPWMEELYRRVSDKQTMGSVVGELRISLGELEKSLDMFFRKPDDKAVLREVPGQLSQMRGVLSVLGLEQASQAVLRMRDSVEQMMVTEVDEQQARAAGTFEQLGNNLGALSFLIDMLNYQPALAKKLFVYDDVKGELRPLMGRTQKPDDAASVTTSSDLLSEEVISLVQHADAGASSEKLTLDLDTLATHAALAGQPGLAKNAHQASVAVAEHDAQATADALSTLAFSVAPPAVVPASQPEESDFEEDDLRDIFLEEAREVAGNGQAALVALARNPADINELTVLRRVFHTLKGSSRMVGLNEFGEAAWSVEQLFNGWLADQKPASEDLMRLSTIALTAFSRWIEDIAGNRDGAWSAATFRTSADAMRTEGRFVGLVLPGASEETVLTAAVPATPLLPEELLEELPVELPVQATAEVPLPEAAAPAGDADIDFDAFFGEEKPASVIEAAVTPEPAAEIQGIDFESLSALSGLPEVVALDSSGVAASPASPSTEGEAELSFELDMPEAEKPADADTPLELSDADFDIDFQALDTSAAISPAVADANVAPTDAAAPAGLPDFDIFEAVPAAGTEPKVEAHVEAEAEALASSAFGGTDEQVKVIGALRIGIPLYNVYLNEADEWSRRLVTEVSEWALELDHPISDSTVALAHSLAGSSATVGFEALSEIARLFEHVLQQSQTHHSHAAAVDYASLFVDAAEDIRRLLHQFAAGFLKEPDAGLMTKLRELEFSDAVSMFPSEPADSGFSVSARLPDPMVEPEPAPEPELESKAVVPEPEVIAVVTPQPVMTEVPVQPAVIKIPEAVVPAQIFVPTPVESFSVEEDDDIDAVDAIDPELFPIFDEEAAELMPQLGGALRQWSSRPDNAGARMEVLRALHTLKGSARLAGALRLGEMAHHIESEIEFLGSEAAAEQDFEPLLTRFDAMEHMLDALRRGDAAAVAPQSPPEVRSVASAAVAAPPVLQKTESSATTDTEKTSVEAPAAASMPSAAAPVRSLVPAPQTMAMQPLRQAASASIRVRSQLLDRMVNQAGEVMITRSRLEVELSQLRGSLSDMSGNLNRLRQQLRDIEVQAESQMQSRMAQAKEDQAGFDPLEFDRFTRVQELTRMMAESVNDVATVQRTLQRTVEATEDDLIAQARQTRELQRDLLRTRMVEFEGISDRLYRVVRLASKETGKQVKLDLLGGTIEMDRGMLDRMTPAFEHLLRNCVAHGIESPAARAAAGKDAAGLITVNLRQEGNDVSVDFSDDGAGLDLKRIREKGISLGLVSAEQALSEQDAANLIFMPGFSTASQVTELSGRGIGMDVVRSEVNAVGGRIETSTVTGKGTHFKLVLPLTTAVTQVVMLRAGSLSIGVPANVVETVRRATAKELQQAYNTGSMDVAGESVPFFWSGALLQSSHNSNEAQGKTTPVVIFRSAAQRIAMHVDEVLGNQEVVVKNLGPQLSRLPGLAGMSVLASGAVVLIYNPVALASVYGQVARALSSDKAEPHMLEAASADAPKLPALTQVTPQIPLILVVDDSITVRRVTQRLLQREGYRVAMAADGLQALERLQEERPAVVLSDIEMPRMDGFDLARNIRGDVRLASLPIVMITSRIAEKHREHARELGVDHYLGKPYSEEELMSLVRHYCNAEVPASA